MAKRLRALRVGEVSLVDKGAAGNGIVRPKILIAKVSNQYNQENKQMDLEAILAALPSDDHREALQSLLVAMKAKMEEELKANASDEEKDKDPEEMAKRANLPEDVRKALEERAALQERVAKLEDERRLDACIKRAAEELASLPGADLDKGKILKAIESHLPEDDAKRALQLLKAAEAIASKSKVFEAIGSSANGDSANPGEALRKRAVELQQKHGLSFVKAYEQACQENKDLVRGVSNG